MNPDIEGLKSYIGGLVLDLFAARGQIKALAEKLAAKDAPAAAPPTDAEPK